MWLSPFWSPVPSMVQPTCTSSFSRAKHKCGLETLGGFGASWAVGKAPTVLIPGSLALGMMAHCR